MSAGGALRACAAAALFCATAVPAIASERYAIVVTGATGGEPYAQKYATWRTSFVETLRQKFDYPADHIAVLAEEGETRKATREGVREAVAEVRRRAAKDDVTLILLIGHGSGGDSDDGKFNLVGPDLSAAEWADLVRSIPGRLVFINTASGSFPFLHALAGRGHVVLTANDSAAQQFETVFPAFFVKAFDDDSADVDKNGKVSIWEAFSYASAHVRGYFEEKGQLATEHPLLDDTGAGIGREADTAGRDGTIAQVTYLQPDERIADTGDTELTSLLRRRADLASDLEQLKARKPNLLPDDYENQLESLLLELARVDRRIRAKS